MKDLKERGKAALAALTNGHVTPRNVELITNYVADSLKVESGVDVDTLKDEYTKGFRDGVKEAMDSAKVKNIADSKEAEEVVPKTTETIKKK